LTGILYGGDERYRLCQETILGIGGVRALHALGCSGLRKYHLNEGHAALAPLELCREANAGRADAEWQYAEVRDRCVFTTHTPVAAGHDRFTRPLFEQVVGKVLPQRVLEMVAGGETVNMTTLALNLSGFVNGVARRHAEVSEDMFPGYGISHVTNGIHSRTWAAPSIARCFEVHLPGWSYDPALLRNAVRIPSDELWSAHMIAKRELLSEVASATGMTLKTETLTLGFARRATLYKRADLIFSNLERLRDLARQVGSLQILFSGKAHPHDLAAKEMIRRIHAFARELKDAIPVVYLPGYDLDLARRLVAGVDLWLNTPQRPLEASGTSGMKAALNGVPSLSVVDGWWVEGLVDGVTGWSIGPETRVPATPDQEAEDLHAKLRHVIMPMFYRHREQWVAVMKGAISLNASFFNSHRMVQQYVTRAYARGDG
jgi:starch phosphorylase